MAKFIVTCTQIWNGSIEVEAENADEAIEIARDNLDSVEFEHGETTADYADEVTD